MNYYSRMITLLLVSMAISMALTWFFGLFIGLALSIGVFILLSMYVRKKRIGGSATTMFGGGINYVCIVCGRRFKGGSCPRCGSKMRKAEF
ncbi:MAG: hypothetical protein ACE5J2_04545 [Nitrososphaerales archaeon]